LPCEQSLVFSIILFAFHLGERFAGDNCMILLVSASPVAERLAGVLQERLKEPVQAVESMKRARTVARAASLSAVVLDESSIDSDLAAEPFGAEAAVLVSVNLAIHDAERVAREVKSALRRAEYEREAAAEAAARDMRAYIDKELTELLLAAELAAKAPALPESAEAKIKQVLQAVQRLRARLEGQVNSGAKAGRSPG
jgi:hypothetical protein